MSYRAEKSGLAGEAQRKNEEKYDQELASQALVFIQSKTGDSFNTSGDTGNFYEVLKDGQLLCKLMNALTPGNDALRRAAEKPQKLAFKQMESINLAVNAMEKMGVSKTELFQTVDLYEKVNLSQVVLALHSVMRKCGLGPKESEKNVREFTEEQKRQGQSIIGLQMGTNKGASQAGMNIGKARHIMD